MVALTTLAQRSSSPPDLPSRIAAVEEHDKSSDQRLDRLDAHLDRIDTHLNQIDIHLASIDVKMDFIIGVGSAIGLALIGGILGLYFKRAEASLEPGLGGVE